MSEDSTPTTVTGRRHRLAAVAGVLIVVSPVAAWWLLGLAKESPTADPDYLVRPLSLSPLLRALFGWTGLVVFVAACVYLLRRLEQLLARRWGRSVLPLVLAGVVVGATYRIVTMAVIGANIGGGLAVFAALLFVPVLIGMAIYGVVRDVR